MAGCRSVPIRTPAKRAFDIARQDPPNGLSTAKATAEIEDVLNSIGDTCPECPPDC
jgi:hypothetical protein